jgi:transposase
VGVTWSGSGHLCAADLIAKVRVTGDNSHRLRSDAALAALCGASPVEASTGQTIRYRLDRGGDRQGNNALWTIANNRMIHHAETRAYVKREPPKARPPRRSVAAASCASSPDASTHSSSPTSTALKPRRLDIPG